MAPGVFSQTILGIAKKIVTCQSGHSVFGLFGERFCTLCTYTDAIIRSRQNSKLKFSNQKLEFDLFLT